MVRPALARELSLVLALKLVALVALFFFFFGPGNRVAITPDVVATTFLADDAGPRAPR